MKSPLKQSRQNSSVEGDMEGRDDLILMLGTLQGEVKRGFENVTSQVVDLKRDLSEQGQKIEDLQAYKNQAMGKSGVVGGVIGLAAGLVGSFIQAGWFHK